MQSGVDTEVTFQYLDSDGSLVPLPVSYLSFYALDEGETLFAKGFGKFLVNFRYYCKVFNVFNILF